MGLEPDISLIMRQTKLSANQFEQPRHELQGMTESTQPNPFTRILQMIRTLNLFEAMTQPSLIVIRLQNNMHLMIQINSNINLERRRDQHENLGIPTRQQLRPREQNSITLEEISRQRQQRRNRRRVELQREFQRQVQLEASQSWFRNANQPELREPQVSNHNQRQASPEITGNQLGTFEQNNEPMRQMAEEMHQQRTFQRLELNQSNVPIQSTFCKNKRVSPSRNNVQDVQPESCWSSVLTSIRNFFRRLF